MSRDLRTLIAEGAIASAHRELALAIAAMQAEMPPHLLHTLRRVETMLRADTIDALAARLQGRLEAEARPC
jgi:hypothetical protein